MSDETPFEVLDDFPETGDLSSQTGGDVIDPAKSVRFKIENVEPRVHKNDSGAMLTAKLNVRASVSPLGIDGSGKYAGKNFFQELLTWLNEDFYTSDWWKKQARFPYRSFLKSLGFDIANPPKVSDEFLTLLKGREFIADIKKSPISVATGEVNESGKKIYRETGDFKNELVNFKAVKD